MSNDDQGARGGYAVPTYRIDGDAWYHFLHGNVPGHEIDFIFRAEVPQPPLTRQHFSHLTRLLRYIEPQSHESFAFAIGNLSRDDTQHEPGHGGVALVFMLRIQGATDHAGRQDPPFAHAVAAIDRALDEVTLIQTAVAFQKHILAEREAEAWYRHYVRLAGGEPEVMRGMCETYLAHFADLPAAEPSDLRVAWITKGVQVPKRVVLVHDDEVSFGEIAVAAARIAAVLYRSDIRWTAITNGREDDIPGGVSVRLVARSYLSPIDAEGVVHELGALPDDEADIAHQLFGAAPVSAASAKQARGWRERFAAGEQRPSAVAPEAPARRSWDALPARVTPPANPESIDETLDLPASPVHVSPSTDEPPNGGRAAMTDIPALPFVPAPTPGDPAPVPTPETAPLAAAIPDTTPRESKRALFLILGGFVVVLAVIIAVVASHGGDSSAKTPPSSAAGAAPPPPTTPSAAPTVSVSAPVPAAPTASVSAAPTVPVPEAPTASVTAKPAHPPRKPPKKGGGTIFDTP